MRYRAIVPGIAVMTISPAQHYRLRAAGFMVHGNGTVKTVYLDYKQYEQEHGEARAYWHEQHHDEYPDIACNYSGCDRTARA